MELETLTVKELKGLAQAQGVGAAGWRVTASKAELVSALKGESKPAAPSGPVGNAPAPAAGSLEEVIANALRPHLKAQISREEFDALAESWIEQSDTLAAQAARIEALEKKVESGDFGGPRLTVSFASPLKQSTVKGLAHRQLSQVITWTAAGVPVWLWGGAGCGKTHMARQVAQALGLPVTIISVDPTMTVGKLVGFRSLADGKFQEGFLFKPYRDGGVVMLDEIDTGDAGILASLNSLLANGHYTFPDGQEVARHPNFRVIAGANTNGVSPEPGYSARTRLDAATLNRFALVKLLPDAGLELAIVCGGVNESKPWEGGKPLTEDQAAGACKRWVQWVHKARAAAPSVLISPRASILGAQAIRAGIPAGEVADALVFALCTVDAKARIVGAAGSL